MKEPLSNIGVLCHVHADERLTAYQAAAQHNYNQGDFVRSRFNCAPEGKPESYEHMWVKVIKTDTDNKFIEGTLSNDPFTPDSILKDGDPLKVSFSEISGYLPG